MKKLIIIMISFFLLLAVSDIESPKPPLTDVTASGPIKKILFIGDSMVGPHECRSQSLADIFFNDLEKAQGYSASSIAVPGNKIQDQLTAWNSFANKLDYDAILILVGHNNCNPLQNTRQSNRINYQSLINSINAGKKPGAKVIANWLVPAKQRWYELGWNEPAQELALNLNQDMKRAISGIDKVNDYHVEILDDGNGNLKPIYRCDDQFHINDAAASEIVRAMRFMIYN